MAMPAALAGRHLANVSRETLPEKPFSIAGF
jgi:hypothetical protein